MRYYAITKLFIIVPLLTLYVIASMFITESKWWILFGFIMYFPLHQLGFNIGVHKLLTHRAFKPNTWYPYLAVFISSICFYGDPLFNVLTHRLHHKYSDTDKDPHSPTKGRWHAFAGWMLTYKPPSNPSRYLIDVGRDYKFLKTYSKIEFAVPIIFYLTLYLISNELFLVVLLGALLSLYNGLFTNTFSHDPKRMEIRNNKFLARFVNSSFMHEFHHDSPGEYDYSHDGVKDYSAYFIAKFLTKYETLD